MQTNLINYRIYKENRINKKFILRQNNNSSIQFLSLFHF